MTDFDLPTMRVPLPWQQSQWERLLQQRQRQQLPHALLLGGPAGIGKRRFAQALSVALLCQSPEQGALTACGSCRACQLLAVGNHPDWLWVAPEERGKAIRIDQVRQIVEFAAQTGQRGERQVVVIEPAEALNRHAANAVLKTLEEPSGGTLLLLVSDAPGRLLPTIRSRCQRLDFPVPAAADTRAWLAPLASDEAELDQLMAETGGRPMAARALLEGDALARCQERSRELDELLEGRLSPLALAQRWKDAEFEPLLSWLSARLSDAVRCALGGNLALLNRRLATLPPARLFALLDEVQRLLTLQRSGSNPNRQLALEALLLHLTTH